MYGQRPQQNRTVRGQDPQSAQGSQSGYRLADKLRQEYRGRGQNLVGIGVASTEELIGRAQMGGDPRENVSEEAFSERLRNPNYTYDKNKYRASTASHTGSRYGNVRHAATGNTEGRTKQKKMPEPDTIPGEVQVQTKGLSLGYILILTLITVMIITVLFSIAQVYRTSNTIADMEKELSSLQSTASKLELAIEEKNDIRVIQQIATEQLGMVKEDSVQRKYISLSDGERIDLIAEEAAEEEGVFGTMLSSIAALFDRIFGEGES